MSLSNGLVIFLPLLSAILIDQASKLWVTDLAKNFNGGWFFIAVFHNHGAILGSFSHLPAILRIVSLSTAGAVTFSIYLFLQYLLPTNGITFKIGLSVLMGGISGNVIDRVKNGYVIDFIYLKIGQFITPVFNLADIFQWIGYAMIIYGLIFEEKFFSQHHNNRKKIWILPSFQLRLSGSLVLTGFVVGLILLAFSYTYWKIALAELHSGAKAENYLKPFVSIMGILIIFSATLLFFVGQWISFKIAGPIFAMEKFFKSLLEQKIPSQPFRLRKHDEFRHLEPLLNQLKDHWKRFSHDQYGQTGTDDGTLD